MQIGTKLLHYQIREKLGEGGMGQVYRALDEKLDREVAIKVLAPSIARDPRSLRRFQREARAVAAVAHPNIVTIYAVEQHDSIHFIAMELVDGLPLSQIISTGGLDHYRLLQLAVPIAEGLAAAHERGITHRDLKPANVMVSNRGQVCILDFGLAKIGAQAENLNDDFTKTEALTREGALLGTVPYMSPEQLEGKSLGPRSDVFSFGIMLYEMATGDRPFKGDSQPALMSAILRDAPAHLTDTRDDLPPNFQRIVSRCLNKEPQARFANAKEILQDLRELATGQFQSISDLPNLDETQTTATSPKSSTQQHQSSIAVLPFINRSSNPEDDYFSDGLSEELINALSRIKGLKVIARSSAFQFRGQEIDVREVGKTLGVESVLEGSVRIAGSRLRITAELVNCADGYQIWAQRFDGEMKDIFDTQDRIAQAIVDQLEVRLGSFDGSRLVKRGTDHIDAYHCLLKARHHMGDFYEPGIVLAIESFERAIELDPTYAQAYADLAFCWLMRATFGSLAGREGFPRVREAAERALALDPDLGDAHAVYALYAWYDFDWETAEGRLQRALDLNPQSVWTHFYAGGHYSITRQHEKILPHVEKMRELDPLNRPVLGHVILFLFYAGHTDEAMSATRASLEMYPDYWFLHYVLSFLQWHKRDGEGAVKAIRKAIELTGDSIHFLACILAAIYLYFDRDEDAKQQLTHIADLEKALVPSALGWVIIEAARNDTDAAIKHFKLGCAEHDTLICWSRAFCERQGLIQDDRLREAMAKAGLP